MSDKVCNLAFSVCFISRFMVLLKDMIQKKVTKNVQNNL